MNVECVCALSFYSYCLVWFGKVVVYVFFCSIFRFSTIRTEQMYVYYIRRQQQTVAHRRRIKKYTHWVRERLGSWWWYAPFTVFHFNLECSSRTNAHTERSNKYICKLKTNQHKRFKEERKRKKKKKIEKTNNDNNCEELETSIRSRFQVK